VPSSNIVKTHSFLERSGAPASGKGTQCELIVAKYGLVHISTGDLLREAVKSGSELGKQAGELMEAGKLVPDDLIIGIVKDRLSKSDCAEKGWLLDGFPRTEAQASALAQMGIVADHFIYLNVPDELLVERVVCEEMCRFNFFFLSFYSLFLSLLDFTFEA
jgi:adenylate kinase